MGPLTAFGPTDVATANEVEGPADTEEIFYTGKTTPFGPAVFVEEGEVGHPLIGSRQYTWGTAGSKPVELARGILLDATGQEGLADRLCRAFTWEIVGLLPAEYFRLGKEEVLAWVEDFRFGELGPASSA